jgi:AraC-like DNA-binding protein
MIFVPLPLFAVFLLLAVLARFIFSRDMKIRSHQLFALLIALYALQSFMLTLRWGYEIEFAASGAAFVAPVLPVLAYLCYRTLKTTIHGFELWPLALVLSNWSALIVYPTLVDSLILLTYFGFGVLLLILAWKGSSQLALSPLGSVHEIGLAMGVTGAALIASALTDIYVIVDFIRNNGQQVGLVVTFVQTTFALLIGLSAMFGRAAAATERQLDDIQLRRNEATIEDDEIVNRLTSLFENDQLHRDEELSLRRLARRLQMPDRKVSNAINRVRGVSVSQFVNEHRIKDACRLLKNSDDNILSISLAAGFATKSNFNREFQRVTGISPSIWRDQNQ